MKKIQLLELFGGIGACTQAFRRLGIPFEIADYVEIDKYAVKSYNAINETSFEPQDITKWDKDIVVDFIMHGSPCQDFSIAGKQAGGDENSGTRSSLMYETIRIVNKLKPKYVLWENVKNLLSKKHRHNFDAYLQELNQLGYNNYYQVLNAKDYGIPQNRERVFTVSIRKDIDKGNFKFPQPEELSLRLKSMLEAEIDEKYYLSDKQIDNISSWKSFRNPVKEAQEENDISNCITAKGNTSLNASMLLLKEPIIYDDYNSNIRKDQDTIGTLTCNCGSSAKRNRWKIIEKAKLLKKELCNKLIKENLVKENDIIRHSYSNSRMNNFYKQNSANNNVSPTLDTRCDCLGVTVNQPPLRIRKLTPKECWRLMGFSDECFEKAEKVNSNAQLYKQAGNSIVVDILLKILKNLFKEK